MSRINPDDFEKILENIKDKISDFVQCDDIRAIESNLNTKAMIFKSDGKKDGTIIVGEDKGKIAVDISVTDNVVRNFILGGKGDKEGIKNITLWFQENYRLEESLR